MESTFSSKGLLFDTFELDSLFDLQLTSNKTIIAIETVYKFNSLFIC